MLTYFKALQALTLITFLPVSSQSFAASPDHSRSCETQLTEPNVDRVLALLKLGLEKGLLKLETLKQLDREWLNPFSQFAPTHESIAFIQAWDQIGAPLPESSRKKVLAQLELTVAERNDEIGVTELARLETQEILAPTFIDRLPEIHWGANSSPLAFGWHNGRPMMVGRFPRLGRGNSDLLWDYFNKKKPIAMLAGRAQAGNPPIPPQFFRHKGKEYVGRPDENLFYDLALKKNIAKEFKFKEPWESYRKLRSHQIISLKNRLYVIAASSMILVTLQENADVYAIPLGEKPRGERAKMLFPGKNEQSGADVAWINGEWIVSFVTRDGPKFYNLNQDFEYPEIYFPSRDRWNQDALAKVYRLNGKLMAIYADPDNKKLVIVDIEAGKIKKKIHLRETSQLGKINLVEILGRPFAILRQFDKLLMIDLETHSLTLLNPPFFRDADVTPFQSKGRTYLAYGGWDSTGLLIYDLNDKFLAGQAGDGLPVFQVLPPFEYEGNLYAYAALWNEGAAIFQLNSSNLSQGVPK